VEVARLSTYSSNMDSPEPLTVREVSAELGCSEDEVRALIRGGELRTVACGIRPGLVPRHEFDDYRRRNKSRLGDRDLPVGSSNQPEASD